MIVRRGIGYAELDDGLLQEGRVGQRVPSLVKYSPI